MSSAGVASLIAWIVLSVRSSFFAVAAPTPGISVRLEEKVFFLPAARW